MPTEEEIRDAWGYLRIAEDGSCDCESCHARREAGETIPPGMFGEWLARRGLTYSEYRTREVKGA